MSARNGVFAALGLGALFLALHTRQVQAGNVLDRATVEAMAARNNGRYGWTVSPRLVAAIAKVESDFNPLAIRFEPWIAHIGAPDFSVGLMQTLVSTAEWLHDGMGYTGKPRPTRESLMDAETSLYFGQAYLHYLSRYRGQQRDADWIIQSYNAGPGNQQAAYLAKVNAALGG